MYPCIDTVRYGTGTVLLVGWLQLPSKEDEPRERNLRDGGVYGEVLYGTVDSMVNAKLSNLVRPMSHV